MAKRIFRATSPTNMVKQVYPINTSKFGYTWERVKDSYRYTKKLKAKLTFENNPKTGALDFDFFNQYEQNPGTKCEPLYIDIYEVCGGVEKFEYRGNLALNSGDWDLDNCTVSISIDEIQDEYSCIEDHKSMDYTFGGLHAVEPGEYYYTGGPFPGKTQVYPQNLSIFNGLTTYVYNSINSQGGDRGSVGYYPFQYACASLVTYMLQDCGRVIDHNKPALKSDFFDWYAPGDTPGYAPGTHTASAITAGTNYVTGMYNYLTHIMVMQKSDAKKPMATQWATQEISYTFDKLTHLWATMWNAYWFIDTDGAIRVEHISYFTSGGTTYDTTQPPHAQYNVKKRKYNYNRDSIPHIEKFVFTENIDVPNGANINNSTNNFDKVIYESICANDNKDNNTAQYQVDSVTTDTKVIGSAYSIYDGNYSEDGLVLLTCIFPMAVYSSIFIDGEVPGETITGDADPNVYVNAHIQWANLIRRYLLDRRQLKTGKNGPDILNFTSNTQKAKSQQNIIYKLCCGEEFLPENASIITDLGIGILDKAEYDGVSDLIKMTVLLD